MFVVCVLVSAVECATIGASDSGLRGTKEDIWTSAMDGFRHQ